MIDNLSQLQEIIKLTNIRDNKFKKMDLASNNDINLIDPQDGRYEATIVQARMGSSRFLAR